MYKKISYLIIFVIAGITAFFLSRVILTQFDYNFEKFFPSGDPDTEFFLEYREKFGTDNDFVLVGLVNNDGIFKKDFLIKVNQLADSLRKVNNVVELISPTDIKEILRDPFLGMTTEEPYLHYLNDSMYVRDSIRIYNTPELLGSIFSQKGHAVALMISHTALIGDADCKELSRSFSEITESYGFDEYHIAGRCIGQSYYTGVMQQELILFLLLAFAFIIATLIIIYRNFWGVLLPLLLVGVNVIWVMGIMQLTGKDVDMLANAIPTITVVVGLSVAVHVMTKFYDYLAHGEEKFPALKKTITQVGLPTIFTTITTVVGFASLKTVGIGPIDDFGVYTAIGVALSFVLSYTFLPALLLVCPKPKHLPPLKEKWSWAGILTRLYLFLLRFKWWILGVFALMCVFSVWGTLQVKEDTKLLEDLSEKTSIKKDFNFFGSEFQGTRPFEMAITITQPGKTVLDRDVLLEMEKMENYLRAEYGLNFILSPVAIIKNAYKSSNGGNPEFYKIPESKARLDQIIREIKAIQNTELVKTVLSDDLKTARVRSMLQDVGSNKANKMNEQFYAFVDENIKLDGFTYKLTGTAELIDKNNRNLAMNLLTGLLVSFVLITIIIAILFKSWKMVLLSLVPNVLPLVMMSAIMGVSGISLKLSTAILFSIALGIAVDDTIHFVSKLRLELKQDKSLMYAIKRTFLTAGKPIVITSVLLCAGFGILGFSSFEGTKNIGILISLILLFALVGDLILLPVLLMLFYRKKGMKVNESGTDKKGVSEKLSQD